MKLNFEKSVIIFNIFAFCFCYSFGIVTLYKIFMGLSPQSEIIHGILPILAGSINLSIVIKNYRNL